MRHSRYINNLQDLWPCSQAFMDMLYHIGKRWTFLRYSVQKSGTVVFRTTYWNPSVIFMLLKCHVKISQKDYILAGSSEEHFKLKFIHFDHIYPPGRDVFVCKAYNFISSLNTPQILFIASCSFCCEHHLFTTTMNYRSLWFSLPESIILTYPQTSHTQQPYKSIIFSTTVCQGITVC